MKYLDHDSWTKVTAQGTEGDYNTLETTSMSANWLTAPPGPSTDTGRQSLEHHQNTDFLCCIPAYRTINEKYFQ